MDDLQSVFYFLWEIFGVLAVLRRQQNGFDPCTESADELLLDATNGRYAPSKGDFALHK